MAIDFGNLFGFSAVGNLLDALLRPLAQSLGDAVFFGLIYDHLHDEIGELSNDMLARAGAGIATAALSIMTVWVLIQGYRIIVGRSQDSLMVLVMRSLRAMLIVSAAVAFGVGSSEVNNFVTETMPTVINGVVTGEEESSLKDEIDKNLAKMQFAMFTVDALKIEGQMSPELVQKKAAAMTMIGLGTAGPPMIGAAMLLLYEVMIGLFVGLGPIFILCLLFDMTKSLFQKWLMYGIGVMFSMAVLAAMVSIATKMMIAVAGALFATNVMTSLLGGQAGLSSMAMQTGGLGLLLTLLIVTTPPMAANFFQGTLGQFAAFSQVSVPGAAAAAAAPGYRPGEPGYRGSGGAPGAAGQPGGSGYQGTSGYYDPGQFLGRGSGPVPKNEDVTKTSIDSASRRASMQNNDNPNAPKS